MASDQAEQWKVGGHGGVYKADGAVISEGSSSEWFVYPNMDSGAHGRCAFRPTPAEARAMLTMPSRRIPAAAYTRAEVHAFIRQSGDAAAMEAITALGLCPGCGSGEDRTIDTVRRNGGRIWHDRCLAPLTYQPTPDPTAAEVEVDADGDADDGVMCTAHGGLGAPGLGCGPCERHEAPYADPPIQLGGEQLCNDCFEPAPYFVSVVGKGMCCSKCAERLIVRRPDDRNFDAWLIEHRQAIRAATVAQRIEELKRALPAPVGLGDVVRARVVNLEPDSSITGVVVKLHRNHGRIDVRNNEGEFRCHPDAVVLVRECDR